MRRDIDTSKSAESQCFLLNAALRPDASPTGEERLRQIARIGHAGRSDAARLRKAFAWETADAITEDYSTPWDVNEHTARGILTEAGKMVEP